MLPSSGVSLGSYIRFAITAIASSFIGSQVIHNIYKPLSDLDKFIEEELNNLPEDQRAKVKELL